MTKRPDHDINDKNDKILKKCLRTYTVWHVEQTVLDKREWASVVGGSQGQD